MDNQHKTILQLKANLDSILDSDCALALIYYYI